MAALGYTITLGSKEESFYGFGLGKEDLSFGIAQATKTNPAHKGVHIAFKAKDTGQIKKFYETAIENGAKDNGKPGPRKNYTETYYAAFVIDLDGNNVEACLYEESI